MKIIVVSSLTRSLVHFRRALLRDMVNSGTHEVVACGPEWDDRVAAELKTMGVRFEQIKMSRASTNPIEDIKTFAALYSRFRKERADMVLAYTQKPIIYGGIAARLLPGVSFFALQSGLGFAFSDENRNLTLRRFVAFLYGMALKKAEALFVFNSDDEADMRKYRILGPDLPVIQVPGSGVDPADFPLKPIPEGPTTFLLVARLLKDKGVYEFIDAARLLRADHPALRFQILGPRDANPTSVSEAEVAKWREEGVVDYLGETKDVRPYLAQSSVFVLPSYHREGLPRSILEAMATGRAIIAADSPGCREPVIEGVNGFRVTPRDPMSLAAAMRKFVDDPDLAWRMGEQSRRLIETKYDVALVNDQILKAMALRPSPGVAPRPRAAQSGGEPLRSLFDASVGAIGLIAALIPLIVGAALVGLTMGRPVFFRQVRAGRGGRSFTVLKLRTMTDARDDRGDLLPDAARTTALGKILRRTRIDELPQFWNLLAGDMGVVGPRPLPPTAEINQGPKGAERLSVKPGLTGWSQVNGNALLEQSDKLALDLWYVRNRSWRLDFKILLKTVCVVLFGEKIDRMRIERAHESHTGRRG
jgi:lipopolysaccharide/colanic/teichoic acid biosynthesis glycosyltransferase